MGEDGIAAAADVEARAWVRHHRRHGSRGVRSALRWNQLHAWVYLRHHLNGRPAAEYHALAPRTEKTVYRSAVHGCPLRDERDRGLPCGPEGRLRQKPRV